MLFPEHPAQGPTTAPEEADPTDQAPPEVALEAQQAQQAQEKVADVVKAGTDTAATAAEVQALVSHHRYMRLAEYAQREGWSAEVMPPEARTNAEVRLWWAEWRELQMTEQALPMEPPTMMAKVPSEFEAAAPAQAAPP